MEQQIELKLRHMRLAGMARGWQALNETRQVHELSLGEGLEILIQREEEERKNNRFNRMIKGARFRYQASLEELLYEPSRGLNKSMIASLATCQYITKGESVLISGATGCGKSYLASALGHQACLHGHSVIYSNTQKFMLRTKMSRADGTILKYFDKIAKASLLILDDFGLTKMDQQQQFDLMEIIEDRHGKASTIIVSQLPPASWFDVISETTIADAILDRLVHSSNIIELKGESLRKKR
ncbi:MAG TPA: IS21-like element helper ATPase IstB [Paludibacter sp.]|jgi:DNA replication protein DnaC|nr:IS21-like element helper ATPase IstB [Paludibacter sp.]